MGPPTRDGTRATRASMQTRAKPVEGKGYRVHLGHADRGKPVEGKCWGVHPGLSPSGFRQCKHAHKAKPVEDKGNGYLKGEGDITWSEEEAQGTRNQKRSRGARWEDCASDGGDTKKQKKNTPGAFKQWADQYHKHNLVNLNVFPQVEYWTDTNWEAYKQDIQQEISDHMDTGY